MSLYLAFYKLGHTFKWAPGRDIFRETLEMTQVEETKGKTSGKGGKGGKKGKGKGKKGFGGRYANIFATGETSSSSGQEGVPKRRFFEGFARGRTSGMLDAEEFGDTTNQFGGDE